MRTIVYIDGFNLYYNAVKNSSNKWLNIETLVKSVLDHRNNIIKIKYFTANVSDRADSSGTSNRQRIYLKALQAHIPNLEIIRGHFSVHAKVAPLLTPSDDLAKREIENRGKSICHLNERIYESIPKWKNDPGPKVHVINTEEKGSDVNQIGRASCRERV